MTLGLSLSEAAMLSLPTLRPGLLLEEEPLCQPFEKLRISRISGHELRRAPVAAADLGGDPDFDDQGGAVGDGFALPGIAGTEPAMLVQDVFARAGVQYTMSGENDQREVQIKAAVKRFVWRFMKSFFQGNSLLSPGEPDGLDVLVSASRRLLPNDLITFQLTLEDLVRLMDAVQAEAPHVAAVSRLGWKSVLYAHYMAGVAPDIAFMEFQDTNGYLATHPVLMFQGVPLLVSDHIADDLTLGVEKDATRIYVYSALKCGAVTAAQEGEPQIVVRTVEYTLRSVERSRLTWSIAPLLQSEDAAAYLTFRPNSHVL